MTTPTIVDFLKYATLQMAAEAFIRDEETKVLNDSGEPLLRVLKCEFRANGASPKFYPVRLFPNNLTEHDDGLAHAVDNTLPCGL
ncbi:hypothetical protein, partial [Candidatus Accumulibacter phosphatis]|uniref:hypothetical protein n=1 Tax=Candidatus Accumulibacter phosphatis TaxID=327160 RepID=UPI001BB22D9D